MYIVYEEVNRFPARGQLNRGKCFFSCPRSRLRLMVSRDGFGRPLPRIFVLVLTSNYKSEIDSRVRYSSPFLHGRGTSGYYEFSCSL